MKHMRAKQSLAYQAKIDALQSEITQEEGDLAAHILTCIIRGSYFNATKIKETHPRALEFAYLHLGHG